jgi:hypothetical protein
MFKSKKLFILFVIIFIIAMIFIFYDFSKKSIAPWKKIETSQKLSFDLIQ